LKQLGIDLADASDYLTDEAREFAVTSDLKPLQNYWREIEVTKTRDKVLTRLKELKAPLEELHWLQLAKQNSDALVATETRSMRLMLEALKIPQSSMHPAIAAWLLSPEEVSLNAEEKIRVAQKIMFDNQYHYDKKLIMEPIAKFQETMNGRAAREVQVAMTEIQWAEMTLFLFAVLIPVVMGFILWIFRTQLSTPVKSYIEALHSEEVRSANFSLKPVGTHELHLLAEAFNHQFRLNQELLEKTVVASQQLETKNWLKTGLAKLNEKWRGEQDILTLAKNTIDFLTTYLAAQVGLFYLLRTDPDRPRSFLHRIASYAYTHAENWPDKFYLGEGLVGQVALEKRAIECVHHPDEYSYIIRSSLSKAIPRHVLLLPFSYEGAILGVIELGSFEPRSEVQRELLEQAMPSLGIAVNSTVARDQMQALLQQSQQQAKELQRQQEELQATNEELQSQSEDLQTQQEELQSTNEELQTQSEELQTQQEELRHANEELEIRTRELERQKEAINEKNRTLEKTRQDIEANAKELEIASKYKSEFLANMSHELRTPLNSLLILSQLLIENKESNLTDKQIQFVHTIHSAGVDLLTIINEVLDWSKIEAGKVDLHQEDVLLSNLIVTIQQKFQPLADKKRLTFTIQLADTVPTVLYTDEQKLKQVVNNLLANAFKFTAQGEVKLAIGLAANQELSSSGTGPRESLAISVMDTGIGIPKDKQEIIFEAFQQADGSTSRSYGGTGLGLSIARQLVRLLEGEIKLQSEVGHGSIFTIYLPLKSRSEIPETRRSKVPAARTSGGQEVVRRSEIPEVKDSAIPDSARPIMPSPVSAEPLNDDRGTLQPQDRTLLIIEDDRNFLRTLMELAREKDFKCIVAEDGKTGLQLAVDYKPDAIILDVALPIMDGWTVMEQLKDNPETRHRPVHFISAVDGDQESRKMGAFGYLSKPVGLVELTKVFKKIASFIAIPLRQLLVVVDLQTRQQQILELVASQEIKTTVATTQVEAYRQLLQQQFDCIVLDVDCETGASLQLLEQLGQKEELSQIPVIVYAERELTAPEETLLHRYENNLILKSVRTPERLLDEVILFLHQVEANLPKEKQKMLQRVHDKPAILIGKKVLIVDDDARNTFALVSFLERQEMEAVVAAHGKEALELLNEHPNVDLVLMDIMMPEMDGDEAMRRIRAQPRFCHLPIIALTAKAMKGDKAKCIDAGANDYITKPVDTNKLMYLMRVWLYR